MKDHGKQEPFICTSLHPLRLLPIVSALERRASILVQELDYLPLESVANVPDLRVPLHYYI
jgi:hypothetical protein